MPQINAKPYAASEKIEQVLFGGRPNIFNSEDLNKELSSVHDTLKRLSGSVGMVRDNWVVNLVLSKDSVNGNTNVYDSQITLMKVDNSLPAYVFYKGIQFELPAGNQLQYTKTFTKDSPDVPCGYLCLVAKKKTVTFLDDPILCGVNSTDYPTSLPSVSAIQYSSERLVYTDVPSAIALGSDEVLIGIIASVIGEDNSDIVRTDINDPLSPYVYAPTFVRVVRYNAVKIEDVIANFRFQYGDELLGDIDMSPVQTTPQAQESNNSLIDLWLLMQEYQKRQKRYLRILNKFNENRFANIEAIQEGQNDLIDNIQQQLALLLSFTQIPVGGIIPYFGSTNNFETSGAGKEGTPMANYHICNGNGGTPDLRGRYLAGAINNVPNEGAPSLAKEVDPTNSELVTWNVNYGLGSKGGESAHKLTVNEMPKHRHALNASGSGSTSGTGTPVQNGSAPGAPADGDQDGQLGVMMAKVGGDQYHNNLPPYYAVIYIMRVQ